jgi:hypothetical protein
MIGPIQIKFRQKGHRVVLSTSGDTETVRRIADQSEVLEGVEVPRWIEMTTSGGPDPDSTVRVELRDGSPVVTELCWTSGPGQSDIKQKHLRNTDVAKLATDLVVSTIWRGEVPMGESVDAAALRRSKATARRFVERQRLPRTRRVMTPEFLQEVARVYRENIDSKPTKAVGEMFNVQSRQASKYVDAARQRGYLPKTVRGQKKA